MKIRILVLALLVMALSFTGCVTIEQTPEAALDLQAQPSEDLSAPSSPEHEPAVDTDDVHSPESTLQPTPESTLEPTPAFSSGYAQAAAMYFEITEALRNVILDFPETYQSPYIVEFDVFPPRIYMTYTKDFSEDPMALNEALRFWMDTSSFKNIQIFHDAPHEYRLTGSWLSRDVVFEVLCKYAPETGALQMISNENGKLFACVELLPLENGEYALQFRDEHSYEKALITYREGKVQSFDFIQYFMSAEHYRSIYPHAQGLDWEWIHDGPGVAITLIYSYDGKRMKSLVDFQ